ncbi:CoA transferase subunit A [Sneathiella limimaris]|uniref:CoA transferase subunit A n=1 Tax=Sneathiella limimaris TaxID=1964213 RepID=UPI00146BD340|nr:CoA-transferase [Sneathiella limimaris]
MSVSIKALVAHIKDGLKLAVPADYAGIAMETTREIIRQGRRNLHIVGVPTSGFQSELLIGAGCVATYESSALTMGEHNPPPQFTRAVKSGSVGLVDATCPAVHAALQASQKGIPFMPLRGIIGSDIVNHHPDWKVIQNPLTNEEDPVILIPAIQPDFSIFHAPMADKNGNIWVGRRRELVNMAQASKGALITVEKQFDGDLLEDETYAAGTLPALYVTDFCVLPGGSWPLGFWQGNGEDSAHLKQYCQMAQTEQGFNDYLNEYVLKEASHV